jgi:hypothetical protein
VFTSSFFSVRSNRRGDRCRVLSDRCRVLAYTSSFFSNRSNRRGDRWLVLGDRCRVLGDRCRVLMFTSSFFSNRSNRRGDRWLVLWCALQRHHRPEPAEQSCGQPAGAERVELREHRYTKIEVTLRDGKEVSRDPIESPKPFDKIGRVATAQNSTIFCGMTQRFSPRLRSRASAPIAFCWVGLPVCIVRVMILVSVSQSIKFCLHKDFRGAGLHPPIRVSLALYLPSFSAIRSIHRRKRSAEKVFRDQIYPGLHAKLHQAKHLFPEPFTRAKTFAVQFQWSLAFFPDFKIS